ncbi:uncharacterized protein LOC114281496 isoform X2 [Camellia sinensis]|uniref:uncharacterized protein LOC114281496 isoform X2 n=1 Tax=Camellia sinensis TaxID=4442 RepID=UPI0010368D19|nr:uncharacterized protein LOC114281496 isoform X2 [Camellia sinensis]
MEAARRKKAIEHEIGGLQNDTLRFGLHSVKSEIVGSHPLQSAYQSTKEVQEQMKRRILVNTYGSAFPLKMDLDRQMLSRCPQLETLSLKGNSMAHAVLNCPLLRDLDIASCHKFSDAAIRSAATSCPLLESLDMSNCSCVSDETLREIACPCGYHLFGELCR